MRRDKRNISSVVNGLIVVGLALGFAYASNYLESHKKRVMYPVTVALGLSGAAYVYFGLRKR